LLLHNVTIEETCLKTVHLSG